MNETISTVLRDIFPAIVPEMVLAGAAAVIFIGGTIRRGRNLWGAVSLAALAIAMLAMLSQGPARAPAMDSVAGRAAVFAGPLVFDHLAWLIRIVALGSGALLVLMSWHEVPESQAA